MRTWVWVGAYAGVGGWKGRYVGGKVGVDRWLLWWLGGRCIDWQLVAVVYNLQRQHI